MRCQFSTSLLIFLFGVLLSFVAAVEETRQYKYAAAHAGKNKLEVGKKYGFIETSGLHRRLIVVRISTIGNKGKTLDANAWMFEMQKDSNALTFLHGASCSAESSTIWDCSTAAKWDFKGEIQDLTFEEIEIKNSQLILNKKCYNILWNNCWDHVKHLLEEVKRDITSI